MHGVIFSPKFTASFQIAELRNYSARWTKFFHNVRHNYMVTSSKHKHWKQNLRELNLNEKETKPKHIHAKNKQTNKQTNLSTPTMMVWSSLKVQYAVGKTAT